MLHLRYIFTLLILLLAHQAQAYEITVDDRNSIDIDGALPSLLVKTDEPIQANQLQLFNPDQYSESIKPGPTGSWHKIILIPNFKSNPPQHRSIVVNSHIIRHLHFYLYDKGELIKRDEIGLIDKNSILSETITNGYMGPTFDFYIQNGTPLTLLLYKQNNGPGILPMTLYNTEGLRENERELNFFWGGVICVLLVMALYNIIVYAMHPSNTYLWYMSFHLLTVIYFSSLNGFGYLIFPTEVQIWLAQNIMPMNFMVIFIITNFAAAFLEIDKNAPKFVKFIKPMSIFSIVGAGISFFIPEYIMIQPFIILQIFGTTFGISVAIVSYRNHYQPAKYFLISWVFTLTGGFIGMSTVLGIMPVNFFTMHGFLFGTLTELFMFSVALAHRMKNTERTMLSQSYTYPDTAIGNFSYLKNILPTLIPSLQEKHNQLILVAVEIHGLKELVGLYGPAALSEYYSGQSELVSQYIKTQDWAVPMTLPSEDTIYLIALPGEQVFLMAAIPHYATNIEKQLNVKKILVSLKYEFEKYSIKSIKNINIDITTGCNIYSDEFSFEENFRQTQIALLTAQQQHIPWLFYSQEQDQNIKDNVLLMSDLEVAIRDNSLELYIQPQYKLENNTLCGGEILLRWQHPTDGFIGPHIFIPLAEKSGLVFPITKYVIENTCKWLGDLKNEHANFYNTFEVSINLSALDMAEDALISHLQNSIMYYGIDSEKIVLEITESAILSNTELFLETIRKLKLLGFRISIDDFGTGYSSMQYLQTMKADEIKIDMAFVRNIHKSRTNQSIANAIIQLAHATGATTVAEGIQTNEEMHCLQSLKCSKAQGYFWSPAVPLLQFEQEHIKPR
jgi:EAL domain-containing protein (putative c-di-GMP-specific phosphodiesterase class I)